MRCKYKSCKAQSLDDKFFCEVHQASLVRAGEKNPGANSKGGELLPHLKQPYLGSRVFNGILIMDCTWHTSKNRKHDTTVYYKCICHCGKMFLASQRGVASNQLNSCGCKGMYRSERGMEYVQWSKLIKTAFGHECQGCGSKEKIISHHILPWGQHKDCRYDLDNGICLCQTCHRSYHKEYGTKENCNRETLRKFIRDVSRSKEPLRLAIAKR